MFFLIMRNMGDWQGFRCLGGKGSAWSLSWGILIYEFFIDGIVEIILPFLIAECISKSVAT